MEEPQDVIDRHIKLFPTQISFLESIDENISNATRKVIDTQIKKNKNQYLEKYLLLFAFGIVFIVFSSFINDLLFALIVLFIGIVYIGYSGGILLKVFIRGNRT